ncbi:MAG: hypothetical protein HC817_13285 [Saprospiraceae bacterium]|nr:hypothetical protein [Saprospiraceae bacterium]
MRVLVEIESLFSKETPLIAGVADRFEAVLAKITAENTPDLALEKMILQEPLECLPPQYRRLFAAFSVRQIPILLATDSDLEPPFAPKTDLDFFKKFIKNEMPQGTRAPLSSDGSIFILEAQSDADAANFIAKTLKTNALWQPSILIPDKNRLLDDAFIQNGLPALGLASASLGRPTLQLLKLVTAFLWRPIDLHKILEFVTLATKPLDNDLANLVANCLSQRPGMDSDLLFAERSRFFRELEEKALSDSSINVKKIKEQYDFWFDRPTYDIEKSAPKDEIIAIFKTLKEWASEEFEASNGKNSSLLVLSEQARRIEDFLNELPAYESFLSYLELDRIIRTIAEPAPVQPKAQELGSLPFCHREACFIGATDNLMWWNFADTEGVHFFNRWYKHELAFFKEKNINLQSPQDENALLLWRRVQPVLKTHKQLILCYLHRVNGENTTEHPLMSHLRACFGDLENVTVKIQTSGILEDENNAENPSFAENIALKNGRNYSKFHKK